MVTLGVTGDGTKMPLGMVKGSTENAAVCTRLVAYLDNRGLDWMPPAPAPSPPNTTGSSYSHTHDV